MRSLKRLLADNLPGAKPELWTNLGPVMRRRLAAWVNEQLDPEWASRPFISPLGKHLLLEVIPDEVVGKPVVCFGVYEYAVTNLLRAYLKAGDTFVDVGANIGYYSVSAAELVGPTGSVIAFEPSPAIRARLQRNVELNQLAQVVVRSEAVGSSAQSVRLVTPIPSGTKNDGLAYVSSEGLEGIEVPCIRLDSLEFANGVPALIKVDVEGGEPAVFEGARRLFELPEAPSIFFESFKPASDVEVLEGYGYRVFQPQLSQGKLALTDDLTAPRYRRWEAPNFIAVKSARGLKFAETFGKRRD